MLADAELTETIIGAAIEVHHELGPGFLESIYEGAFSMELDKRHIPGAPTRCAGLLQGEARWGASSRPSVADTIGVELKAIRALEDVHFAVVRSYLRATNHRHGLLLNFFGIKMEIRRVIAGG
jgi:GxxExxY protein